jgi:hypothetical protein
LAAARAQRLMLEHNLDQGDTDEPLPYQSRQLGSVRGRFSAHEKMLAGLLGEHFFVVCIWMNGFDAQRGVSGRYLEVSGTPENLDMAAWVHSFVSDTAERLWREHKRSQGIRGDRERRRYLAGVVYGFGQQLRGQARQNRQEGLIWLGDPGLEGYYRTRHPRVRTGRGPRIRATDAWRDGQAAGRDIVMHRPVAGQAAKGGRKLITGG